ncbi:MAG: ATP-binding protein [Moraxellaceae bacterium]|nr:ATP-binding protein [Moraxellaceae bacterium]MDP1775687.1 ATP-binding protein [Moraxellaceae bacterium]MDZ4387099.1 ATP-binding protein [Moraxellaceae bacterium]
MRRNLIELCALRFVMLAIFVLALSLGWLGSGILLHELPIILPVVLSLFVLVNVLTAMRLKRQDEVHPDELFLQLLIDIMLLTGLFYATGGSSNPFVTYYLVPLAIATSALSRQQAMALAVLMLVAYSMLVWFPDAQSSHLAWPWQSYQGHLLGMWVNFVISVLVIAIFLSRMQARLREQERSMAIAQRHLLQRQQAAAMGALAADAVHDLATPLASMTLLADELVAENDSALLQSLQSQLRRCRHILSNLRDQARAPEQSPQKTLAAHIDSCVHDLKNQFHQKNLHIDLGNQGEQLLMLPWLLRQVISNGLKNAFEAASSNVWLSVESHHQQLEFRIEDDGEGYSVDLLQAMTEPSAFATSTKPDGLGLGLYLAHVTLTDMGGQLMLANRQPPFAGACLTMRLPVAVLQVMK